MIINPEWQKSKEKSYFNQISLDCIEKLVVCMESIDIKDIDCDTCLKMQEILSDEFDDPEFIKNNYMWEHIRRNNLFKNEETEYNHFTIKA